jgi:hypothetical protein
MTRQRYPLSKPEDVAIDWDNYTGDLVTGYKAGVTKAARTAQGLKYGTREPSLQCKSVYIKATGKGFAGQTKRKAQADTQ